MGKRIKEDILMQCKVHPPSWIPEEFSVSNINNAPADLLNDLVKKKRNQEYFWRLAEA